MRVTLSTPRFDRAGGYHSREVRTCGLPGICELGGGVLHHRQHIQQAQRGLAERDRIRPVLLLDDRRAGRASALVPSTMIPAAACRPISFKHSRRGLVPTIGAGADHRESFSGRC